MTIFGQKYSLTSGGLLNILFEKIMDTPLRRKRLRFKIIFFGLTMGIPLFVLAQIQDILWNPNVEIPLLEDYETLTRLFFVVPLFIGAVGSIDPAFNLFLDHVDDMIVGEDKQKFFAMMNRVEKLTKSILPELIFILSIYIKIYYDLETKKSVSNWLIAGQGLNVKISYAGWWFLLYCLPIFQLLMISWFWRWIICIYILFRISRMNVKIYPAHADLMGGLRFFGILPFSFNIFTFAMGSILASSMLVDILNRGETFEENFWPIIVYIVIMAALFLGPLTFFVPMLTKGKISGIFSYGLLINRHHEVFNAKWMEKGHIEQSKILGNMDASSMADINGGYESIREMKTLPISKYIFYRFIFITALPFIPLIFTELSFEELYQSIVQRLIG